MTATKVWQYCVTCKRLRSSCDESVRCFECRTTPGNREQLIQQNNEPLSPRRRRWFRRDRHL